MRAGAAAGTPGGGAGQDVGAPPDRRGGAGVSGPEPGLAAYRCLGAFARQLRASGVRHAVIAPGSRSTPLVLALDRQPGLRAWLHLDERAAGYFALGLARQLREPVAVATTSGTAAANLLPAIAEASLSRVPLIALTADRPPELRGVGANQTIEQRGLFGSHARWAAELPIASGDPALEAYAARTAARAAAEAGGPPAGAVHLNVPLREPLIARGWEDALDASAASAVAVTPAPRRGAAEAAEALLEAARGRSGLIVCGPANGDLPARAIAGLARALGWPAIADPLSGLRAGAHPLTHVVDAADALLRSPRFAADAAPEAIVRFGAAPTSKALSAFLAAQHGVPHLVVDDDPGGWRDPDAAATAMLRADPEALCAAALEALAGRRPRTSGGGAAGPAREASPPPAPDPGGLAFWTGANAAARRALDDALASLGEPFEGALPGALASVLPGGSTLVAGNSMIVRDVDSFFPATARRIRIVGTRGASGIDGVLSAAAGAAAAGDGPVAALVGDLSFLHDLNGLWPLRRHGLPLLVALAHNDGGGIFHFLPQRELAAERFEAWFGTPHGLDFEGAIAAFGGRLLRAADHARDGWDPAIPGALLRRGLASPGLTVVELRTGRERNAGLHRELQARVDEALRGFAPAPPAG